MRKSIVLFALLAVYIWGSVNLWGCSGSEDKYDLITKEDRKAVKSICQCMEPLTEMMKNMTEEKDSTKKLAYFQTLQEKAVELMPCLEKVEKLEVDFDKDEKYTKQLIDYIKEKHPDCMPFFIGTRNSMEIFPDSTNGQKNK